MHELSIAMSVVDLAQEEIRLGPTVKDARRCRGLSRFETDVQAPSASSTGRYSGSTTNWLPRESRSSPRRYEPDGLDGVGPCSKITTSFSNTEMSVAPVCLA
jgi:hypothetical protein